MSAIQNAVSYQLPSEHEPDPYHGVYAAGPFKGRPIVHPYSTVMLRLSKMGVSPPERQFDETDKGYIIRMDRTYTGLFHDIVSSGILEGND